MRLLNRLFGKDNLPLVAVIDVETTGLNPYRHDRIVEMAALVVLLNGTVIREFVTLVNPERDIGPTRIHGITTQDILSAPRFGDIAGSLLEMLDGCVTLVGHNVRFDHSFLTVEFDRLGYTFPHGPTLCTMQLSGGGSLGRACIDYGIMFKGQAHSALHDASATAQLLGTLLKDAPRLAATISRRTPISWPHLPKATVSPVTRHDSAILPVEPPDYLRRLLSQVQPDLPADDQESAIFGYIALLDRVLEDRHIDEQQGQALFDLATNWRISSDQIKMLHRDYLLRLVTVALGDGVLMDAELRDLQNVASLLGIDSNSLESMLETVGNREPDAQFQPSTFSEGLEGEEFLGKRVCFTGQCQCRLKGEVITREIAERLVSAQGLDMAETVTKKLDILVVADPLTQSGKAKKARQYGIRVIYEPVFWKALGLEVE